MADDAPPYDPRADLVPALHELLTFCGGVLDLARQLLVAIEDGGIPTEADRQRLREGIARWQQQVDGARQRANSLLIEPPDRLQ
jgi:hypothetical protein